MTIGNCSRPITDAKYCSINRGPTYGICSDAAGVKDQNTLLNESLDTYLNNCAGSLDSNALNSLCNRAFWLCNRTISFPLRAARICLEDTDCKRRKIMMSLQCSKYENVNKQLVMCSSNSILSLAAFSIVRMSLALHMKGGGKR
eukprot:17697-Heterococcus_DN1.PRE.2